MDEANRHNLGAALTSVNHHHSSRDHTLSKSPTSASNSPHQRQYVVQSGSQGRRRRGLNCKGTIYACPGSAPLSQWELQPLVPSIPSWGSMQWGTSLTEIAQYRSKRSSLPVSGRASASSSPLTPTAPTVFPSTRTTATLLPAPSPRPTMTP